MAGFRIEWNPNNQGIEGNEKLWEALEHLLSAEYDSFIAAAIVTRVDVAVDGRGFERRNQRRLLAARLGGRGHRRERQHQPTSAAEPRTERAP